MKKLVTVCLFVFAAVWLQAQTLTWDIKFFKIATWETLPINQIIRMETGEGFTISITPASDCYAYIFCYDSERDITVIMDGLMKAGNETYLDRFEVGGPSGIDTFYVVMSLARQTRLENLIQIFNSNPSQQNGNTLYREVVSLQNSSSGLGEPASVFIASGGTSRGSSVEYATRFSEKNMYVRAISIRH
jgi:hypothetical protein